MKPNKGPYNRFCLESEARAYEFIVGTGSSVIREIIIRQTIGELGPFLSQEIVHRSVMRRTKEVWASNMARQAHGEEHFVLKRDSIILLLFTVGLFFDQRPNFPQNGNPVVI